MLQQLHDRPPLRLRPPSWWEPPRSGLLLLHRGIERLVALAEVLLDEGYPLAAFACVDEARAAIDGAFPPAILLTPAGGRPMPGMVFARECLAARPLLRVLYLTPFPWSAAVPLVCRERMLRVPCTAEELGAALGALAPAPAKAYGSSETGTAVSRPLAWQRGVA
jgi:hypothetical protein